MAGMLVFVLAHFGHHLCTATAIPLIPMIRDTFHLDYFQSGVLISAFSLTYGFAQLPMAAIAERLGKRRVVAAGLIGTGAACLSAGLSTSFLQITLSMVMIGIAGSTYHAPAAAFLSQMAGKSGRGQSLGMHVIGGSGGLMAAPVLAILVANLTGSWRNSFLVAGLPVFIAGVLVWTMLRSQEISAQKRAAAEPSEPIRVLALLRVLGLLVVVALLTQLLVSSMVAYLPLYLVDRHGVPTDTAGLMLGVFYGAGILGAPLGGALSDRIGRRPVIMLSVVFAGPLIFLMTIARFDPLMIALIATFGLFIAFRLPAIEALIADIVPAGQRAVVLAGYYFMAQETAGVFTPVVGLTMDQLGLGAGFSILAAMALAVSLLVVLLWKKV